MSKEQLLFCPLGGSGEIGGNMNLYAYGKEDNQKWIIVDMGVSFADDSVPGVDLIMPDAGFIIDKKDDLLGIVLTHAHEDHIGAVAHLWPHLKCKIYATPFTAALILEKFKEKKIDISSYLEVVALNSKIKLGDFEIDFVTLTHSILEPNGLSIKTPLGTVLHTGDWKIDPNNIDELEKTFNFILKVYKKNKPELFDVDTFKIIYSENNYAPVFGKTAKWIVEEGNNYEYKIPVDDPNVNDSILIENIGAQLPRGMSLDSESKTIYFDVDYNHVERSNSTQNYNLELKASDISGLSSQISLDVVVMNTINPQKVKEKISELISELNSQQKGLEEINENLKWIEATSKNNRVIRTFSAAGITFLGAVVGVISANSEGSRKAVRLAGPIIGASGAVLSVINEVLSRDDNEIKNLLQETIKLQSNVKAKYDRLSFYNNSQNTSDFQNQEIDLLIRTIESDRESLNKNLFTISENYKIIISEKRIKNMLDKRN